MRVYKSILKSMSSHVSDNNPVWQEYPRPQMERHHIQTIPYRNWTSDWITSEAAVEALSTMNRLYFDHSKPSYFSLRNFAAVVPKPGKVTTMGEFRN